MGRIAILIAATTCMFLATNPAWAQNSQQDKMKTCNAEASQKALKGAERSAFMKTCLSNAPAGNSQQEKMKACNANASAKGLKGDARKSFMSACLSGK